MVTRHWKFIVVMARDWLTHTMLPSKYWYFAVKQAVEVATIMPVTIDEKLTTPYEDVYHQKPGYCTLIPMFATSYIRQHRENSQD